MFDFKETLQKMKRERASMQAEVEKLEQAIAALAALAGNKISTLAKSGLSAKVRGRVSSMKKSAKKKRKISAEGLKNIIRAQNRRWAKVRAAAKAKAKAAGKMIK